MSPTFLTFLYEARAKTVRNLNNAREFNTARAQALRSGQNQPGSIARFNEALRAAKLARLLRCGGYVALIGGIALIAGNGPTPPLDQGIPEDAEYLKSEYELNGERQYWKLATGETKSVLIQGRGVTK
jgi:hypothetical protein